MYGKIRTNVQNLCAFYSLVRDFCTPSSTKILFYSSSWTCNVQKMHFLFVNVDDFAHWSFWPQGDAFHWSRLICLHLTTVVDLHLYNQVHIKCILCSGHVLEINTLIFNIATKWYKLRNEQSLFFFVSTRNTLQLIA